MTSRSKGSNPLLSAALAYAERGWRVFPLVPRDKMPLTPNGLHDATDNHADVLRYWQMFPYANLGLACGAPFDVLDLDSADAVRPVLEVLGNDYRHSGPVVSTGKGWHFYFASDPEARNRAGLFGGKVDYRGAGGYVVAPPSIHPSGRRYQWDDTRGPEVGLPQLPDALRQEIVKPPTKPPRPVLALALSTGDGTIRYELNKAADIALARPDILELMAQLGRTVNAHGAYWITNCIFHDDPGPSMVLYPADNSFHCYGCEAHGDSLNIQRGQDMTGRKVLGW